MASKADTHLYDSYLQAVQQSTGALALGPIMQGLRLPVRRSQHAAGSTEQSQA